MTKFVVSPDLEEQELIEMGMKRPDIYVRQRRAYEEAEREEKHEYTV